MYGLRCTARQLHEWSHVSRIGRVVDMVDLQWLQCDVRQWHAHGLSKLHPVDRCCSW